MIPRGLCLIALLLSASSLGAEPPDAANPSKSGSATSSVSSEERARSYFTDTVLLTQDAKKVRFYSDVLKDRVVVISFLFTRCQGACPLLAQKLNQVRNGLGELYGRDIQFVSLSVDPGNDTPEALQRFATKHGAPTRGWTFLTGESEDVHQVLRKLGQLVDNVETHSTGFIAGNVRTKHWTRFRPEASPSEIVARLRLLAEEK